MKTKATKRRAKKMGAKKARLTMLDMRKPFLRVGSILNAQVYRQQPRRMIAMARP
jgi:hypothetical protein